MSEFLPKAVIDLELSGSWPDVASRSGPGGALLLVRLHSRPIGVLELTGDEAASGADLPGRVLESIGPALHRHLASDGYHGDDLLAGALESEARCLQSRARLMNGPPSVTVAIATKDRPTLIDRCLQSVTTINYPNFEVVVVDSSADNATKEIVESGYPSVRYVRNRGGRVCVAKSRSIREATSDIVAFTDDDATVDRSWIEALVDAFLDHPKAACVTGAVMPFELETSAQMWFEESGAFVEGFERRVISLATRNKGSLLPYATSRIGAGVNMAWKRSVLEEIDAFDVALDRTGAEDLAAFYDALCGGYEIVFEPSAVVWHQHRRTVEELLRQVKWHSVGLGAYLTRCITTQPGRLPDMLARIPAGVRYGFASTSPRNSKQTAQYPREFRVAEIKGFCRGPFEYALGAWAKRHDHSPSAV